MPAAARRILINISTVRRRYAARGRKTPLASALFICVRELPAAARRIPQVVDFNRLKNVENVDCSNAVKYVENDLTTFNRNSTTNQQSVDANKRLVLRTLRSIKQFQHPPPTPPK